MESLRNIKYLVLTKKYFKTYLYFSRTADTKQILHAKQKCVYDKFIKFEIPNLSS